MGAHHSHDVEIDLKMFLDHQTFIPEIFIRSPHTHEFSIKTREILHYMVPFKLTNRFYLGHPLKPLFPRLEGQRLLLQ